MRTDVEYRRGQFQIGHVVGVEFPGRHGEAGVDAVAAGVGADGVALGGVADGADDGAADEGVGVAPAYGDGVYAEGVAVGGEVDVVELGYFGDGDGIVGGAGLFGGGLVVGGGGAHCWMDEVVVMDEVADLFLLLQLIYDNANTRAELLHSFVPFTFIG